MISSLDVVSKIGEYLDGKINLDSFRQWVVSSQVELEGNQCLSDDEKRADRLLSDVEGQYAELSDSMVSDGIWKECLRSLSAPQAEIVELGLTSFSYQLVVSPSADLVGWSSIAPETANVNPNFQPIDDRSLVAA